jgi:hypothetical protein
VDSQWISLFTEQAMKAGVAAQLGLRIERARFTRPVPLAVGFNAIEAYVGGIGRSPTAFCACELRSPAQFTDAGFVAFNRHYVERLAWCGPSKPVVSHCFDA